MNKKMYWKIRKIILTVLFKCKSFVYRGIDFTEANIEYKSFKALIFKKAFWGVLRGLLFAFVLLYLDGLLLKIKNTPIVDGNIVVNVVIGGISVAGVILGLYCANISSIYSMRYANAPKSIANAFQYDRLIRKCTSAIIDYIIFGFIIIVEVLLNLDISWATTLTTTIWSVIVIISYSIAGNRSYQLSDIYRVADDSYIILHRIILRNVCQKVFSTDANFQNHFLKVAEKQIELLKTIQKYGSGITRNDNSTMVEFMCNNLALIENYWKIKKSIGRTSLWFRDEVKYQKWHLTSDIETSIPLRTGTTLRIKCEHNYWWFEDEIMSINRSCLNNLIEERDFTSLYKYLNIFEKMCRIAISCKEVNYYVNHVNYFKNLIEKNVIEEEDVNEQKKSFTGVVEMISLLYLNLILESSKFCDDFDINKIIAKVISSIDAGKDIEKSSSIRGRDNIDFYNKILTEVSVEGKRITPDWLIKQCVAKEEYVYLNSLIDIVREGINHIFNLGKLFADKHLYFEACIILTRFYEYESKLIRFIKMASEYEDEIKKLHVDSNKKWDEFRIDKLKNTLYKWKNLVPKLLFNSSSEFALENWENRDEYPDFLGECYNHICEDIIESIINNDIKQFKIDFENLSELMLLYQEYIRSDFIKNKDLYRIEYAYYMFTSPIVEWAQIGGLAILWGEFYSCDDWIQSVKKGAKIILKNDDKLADFSEKLIDYIQRRERFMITGSRDILEIRWKQSVINAIKKSGKCEAEYEMYGKRLKTDSKLLQAFCSDFMEIGFRDTSEVFWILCVNPLLPKEKRFKTRYSWEDKMNE